MKSKVPKSKKSFTSLIAVLLFAAIMVTAPRANGMAAGSNNGAYPAEGQIATANVPGQDFSYQSSIADKTGMPMGNEVANASMKMPTVVDNAAQSITHLDEMEAAPAPGNTTSQQADIDRVLFGTVMGTKDEKGTSHLSGTMTAPATATTDTNADTENTQQLSRMQGDQLTMCANPPGRPLIPAPVTT